MLQVCIRMRPLLKHENETIWYTNNNIVYTQQKQIIFDQVEVEKRTQQFYNKTAKANVRKALDGFHTTIMCYGQTTSGKTFTTLGSSDNPGILPCALRDVFLEKGIKCSIQYIQIYNEIIDDLLDEKHTAIQIITDKKWGTTLQLQTNHVTTFEQAIELLNQGEERRIYRETLIHDHSSRSHTIFRIFIENKKQYSCLNIVDLAGSERINSTDINNETGYINKSLLALTNVINQLSEQKNQHISYRDSKLTRLLQNSLGGNSVTLLICCISPGNYNQTLSTLQFATRAKTVKNVPVINLQENLLNQKIPQNELISHQTNNVQNNFLQFFQEQQNSYPNIQEYNLLLSFEQDLQNEYAKILMKYQNKFKEINNNIPQLSQLCNQYTDLLNSQILKYNTKVNQKRVHQSEYKLIVWGSGQDGRLGTGNEKTCKIPTQLQIDIKFSKISCGFHHTLGISDGFVYSWGKGQKGQLGLGDCQNYLTPQKIESLQNVTQIKCGWQHSLAISEGNLFSWGLGEDGQLGDGIHQQRNTPQKVFEQVDEIFAGHSNSGFISQGMLYTFGNNSDGRCMLDLIGIISKPEQVPLNDIKSVSLGVSHMGVVTKDGCVYMAGTSIDGQLGIYNSDDDIATWFTQIEKFNSSNKAESIQCGDSFTLILNTKGIIYAFGKASYKRLGLPTQQNIYEPTPLPFKADKIYTGCRHACASTKDGHFIWGFNFHNQLGQGDDDQDQEPIKLNLEQIQDISLGYFHSVALIL